MGSRKAHVRKFERRGFLAGVHPLLTAEERGRFDDAAGKHAFQRVFDRFIGRIPGKMWATTPDRLKKHGLADIS
jgi:hypothetical protein